MWSGASVEHTTLMREDLGAILTQTQDGILMEKLSSPFFQYHQYNFFMMRQLDKLWIK